MAFVVGGRQLFAVMGRYPYSNTTLRSCPARGIAKTGEKMKLRKNKTTPKSCQLSIADEICLNSNNGAGWNEGDEILARVVKKKSGNTIELMRASDVMAFMSTSK